MKNIPLIFLMLLAGFEVAAQEATKLKPGVYKSHDDYTDNDPSKDAIPEFSKFIRVNKIDKNYSDTLYKLVDWTSKKMPFAIYDGSLLYINTEDSLFRKMDYIGRYAYVRQTTKVHYEGRWVVVNKSPIWQDEHDEVQSWITFLNKKGDLVGMGFDSVRELLKGNHDLIVDFDREKWNERIFLNYLHKMNERYPIK